MFPTPPTVLSLLWRVEGWLIMLLIPPLNSYDPPKNLTTPSAGHPLDVGGGGVYIYWHLCWLFHG